MTLYQAKKDNTKFYIQPDMIEAYSKLGYIIIKQEEVEVNDVKSEVERIASASEGKTDE